MIAICVLLFAALVVLGLKNDLSNFYFNSILWVILFAASLCAALIIARLFRLTGTHAYIVFCVALACCSIFWLLVKMEILV